MALQPFADPVTWRRVPVNSLLGIAFGHPNHQDAAGVASRSDQATPSSAASCRRLVLDTETFEACWGEKCCFLGNTIEFRLLQRLNHRPSLFVSINALRASVWNDDDTEKNTIQRTASNLRRRLREAGLENVQIDGSQKDHYRLILPA